MPLRDIISGLPELTADELSVVIATASQLKAVKSGSAQGRRGNRGGPSRPKGGKKGQSQTDSPWKEVPEYQAFRAAEKELHSFLKKVSLSLKQAEAAPSTRDDPVLQRFREAQSTWFRRKTELTHLPTKSQQTVVQVPLSSGT
jgi:hypothetical protein